MHPLAYVVFEVVVELANQLLLCVLVVRASVTHEKPTAHLLSRDSSAIAAVVSYVENDAETKNAVQGENNPRLNRVVTVVAEGRAVTRDPQHNSSSLVTELLEANFRSSCDPRKCFKPYYTRLSFSHERSWFPGDLETN